MKQILNYFLLANLITTSNLAETNYLSFSSPTNINISNTEQVRRYSLQSKINLNDEFWTEESNLRGNEGGLVFNIQNNENSKFFKSISSYIPIEPQLTRISRSFGQNSGIHDISENIEVINYEKTNIEVIVNFNDIMSVGVTYRNTPFNQILIPGTNQVIYQTIINTANQTSWTTGDVIINRI